MLWLAHRLATGLTLNFQWELIMRTLLTAIVVCSTAVAGYFVTVGTGTSSANATDLEPGNSGIAALPAVSPVTSSNNFIVHEWGTFTSFSGSNGVPVGFEPNNADLPSFVYQHEGNANSKSNRLHEGGTVSMETPVIYFYTDKETRASVRVDFPKGWITEWYPFASTAPGQSARQPKGKERNTGETIRWNVKLLPGEQARFPRDKGENHYYHARETDAVPLQAELEVPENQRDLLSHAGVILQREKFLFYRGVGTFPTPVVVHALGGGKIRVANAASGRLTGLVLLTVRDGRIGFRPLDDIDAGAETIAMLPETNGSATELAAVVVKGLAAAGLYEREARAMVKTWDSAWFREEGTRLLYLVPRARTDELLPLTIDPKPTEVIRVLVGRHDFLTPEQEIGVERQMERIRAAQAEQAAAEKELAKIGRFSWQARQMAARLLEAKAQQK